MNSFIQLFSAIIYAVIPMAGFIMFPFRPRFMFGCRNQRGIPFGIAAFTVLRFASVCGASGLRIHRPLGAVLMAAIIIFTDIGQYIIAIAAFYTG